MDETSVSTPRRIIRRLDTALSLMLDRTWYIDLCRRALDKRTRFFFLLYPVTHISVMAALFPLCTSGVVLFL